MKTLILTVLAIGTATSALAADCTTEATTAAKTATLQSDLYYHCGDLGTTFNSQKGDYLVQFACVGEAGSGVLSYSVSFSDDDACSAPTVTAL